MGLRVGLRMYARLRSATPKTSESYKKGRHRSSSRPILYVVFKFLFQVVNIEPSRRKAAHHPSLSLASKPPSRSRARLDPSGSSTSTLRPACTTPLTVSLNPRFTNSRTPASCGPSGRLLSLSNLQPRRLHHSLHPLCKRPPASRS